MAYFHTTVLDNQIKALPTVSTASGSIATFDTDMTENLVEVKCQIVAQQGGSGTPSPDNVRPILTHDSMSVFHNSINLWNEQWRNGHYNSTTGIYQTNANKVCNVNPIPVKPDTEYYFVTPVSGTNVFMYDENMNYVLTGTKEVAQGETFTTTRRTHFINFSTFGSTYRTYNNDISLNYPPADTQYHAFNGAYIPFGQTVAQGTLNVSTGKCVITLLSRKLADLTWIGSNGIFENRISTEDLHTAPRGSTTYCEIYRSSGYSSSAGMYDKSIQTMGGANSSNFWVKDTDYLSVTDFVNSLGNYKVVYELASPLTVQLDSNTITALLNENNIWCDTGDTEVKYLLSVGKKIS